MQIIPELVGITEIGKIAGVGNSAVCNWIKRYPDFPWPVAVLALGSVWWKPEVIVWMKQHGKFSEITFEI